MLRPYDEDMIIIIMTGNGRYSIFRNRNTGMHLSMFVTSTVKERVQTAACRRICYCLLYLCTKWACMHSFSKLLRRFMETVDVFHILFSYLPADSLLLLNFHKLRLQCAPYTDKDDT